MTKLEKKKAKLLKKLQKLEDKMQVWSEGDIINDTYIAYGGEVRGKIVEHALVAKFNILNTNGYIYLEECLLPDDMADYLNAEGFEKL